MVKYQFESKAGTRSRLLLSCLIALLAGFYAIMLSAQVSSADNSGYVEIRMSSSLPDISDGNPAYTLASACYGIYSDYQCTQYVGYIETDESGYGISDPLVPGRYFIRQELASEGFSLSEHLCQADVAIGKTTSIDTSETPCYGIPDVIVREVNDETGNAAGVAGARLGNGKYAISYYCSDDASTVLAGPLRTWTFVSNQEGKVILTEDSLDGGSPLFAGPQGTPVLPVGHYTICMQSAPLGFMDSGSLLVFDIIGNDVWETDPVCTFETLEMRLQVIRGDVLFRKVDENQNPLASIPFMLTCSNGEEGDIHESHVVVTDENGDFTSDAARTLHTHDTNQNDAAVTPIPGGLYSLDESLLAPGRGTWFSQDATTVDCAPDDSLGALPYGSYVLQELPCSANAGMNLATVQFSVYRNGFTTALDNIVGTTPVITSEACDATDSDRLMRPAADSSIIDTVSYHNLVPGKRYTLESSLISLETGEALQTQDGTLACVSSEIIPSERDGRVSVKMDVDASQLAGRKIVVCERLVAEDGMVISLSDVIDEARVIEVEPIIHASAHDFADKDKYVMGTDAIIVEHITYDGLVPGKRYLANAALNDKATGSLLRNAQGQIIEANVEFTPQESTGEVNLELPVDTTSIVGHDIVVFDRMSNGDGELIASHQDLEDDAQTVKTVKLVTSAADKADGDKIFDAKASEVTIVDSVKYANLVVGEQYELHGSLMDKETGTALNVDGNPITATVPFVPKEVSGSVDVELTFDASIQTSEVLVAFETLMHDGNVIAEHADLDDVAQTVTSQELDAEPLNTMGTAQEQDAYAYGKGPKTGDILPRAIGLALLILVLSSLSIAYAAHRRRVTLEAIARSSEIRR